VIGGLATNRFPSELTSKLIPTKVGRSSWNRGSTESTWKFFKSFPVHQGAGVCELKWQPVLETGV
jgi:hypothetical protein